jgi:uncharacterized membrane protein SpoIIM required for sporulation
MSAALASEPPPAAPGPARDFPAIALRSNLFRKLREPSWRELDQLVARVERRGVRALSADELERLPSLYRTAQSSLSVARSIALDRNLLIYLESLALRGFLAVYGPRSSLWEGCADFLRRGFPRVVRSARWHILFAALVMLLGAIAGFTLVMADESWFAVMVPGSLSGGRGPSSTRADLLTDEIFAPWPGMAQAFALMANFLFTHNSLIGFLAFGLGIAGGVPTILLLAYQGLILGAFLALHADRGLAIDFLGWISIHGVTELTAITLCGAAGLVIGDKVLFPGRHARLDSLAIHGRSAAQIVIGAVLLLFVAGILEGGFRQLVQSTELRFAIGGLTGLVWLLYFVAAGRR